MFSRVLVANRGEIAVRVIRALHELGVEAVAVYSTAEREALHVRMADQAVCIGPPSATDSYLRIPNVVAAAETTGCEAVHPGFGFLSENPAFVRACTESDLVFIGPPAEVMEKTGDKARAKAEMRAAGVPLVPGTEGVASLAEIKIAAVELGFPVLLKATSGGGGKGMRVVNSPADLEAAYGAASAEAEASFGDGSLYLERALVPARHVEIQVLCDTEGGVLTLGERECSIQRRHQKLVEESPSLALTPETREAMEASVERACRQLGYVNAGTFEFLLGPDGAPSFIEVNCRLQVEHPVTEMTTGIDIVREQLRIAAGEPLTMTGRAPRSGHAIEVRINAEDPRRDFAPAAGTITRFRPPLGPGVRVDTAVIEGAAIPPFYDSMIAKVIVHDDDPRCRDRPRDPGARGARGGGHPDDARRGARHPPLAGVPGRRLLDQLPCRDGRPPAIDAAGGSVTVAKVGRRQSRRTALFLLYQWDLTGQPMASLYDGTPDDFALQLAEAIAERAPALDERITAASDAWSADRLGTLERNVLRIGVYELEEGTVPAEVAINEAVVLAKRYATEDAARLVNGILGRIDREAEA